MKVKDIIKKEQELDAKWRFPDNSNPEWIALKYKEWEEFREKEVELK